MTEANARPRGRPKKGEERGLSDAPFPHRVQPAVGIDIGVEGFHLCVPGSVEDTVKDWDVWHISYEKHPDWRERLRGLLGEDTVVVCEPTGWNYLQPVARVVSLESPAELWLIEHSRTAAVRGICNMEHKTDLMDTRALAFAAMQLRITRKFAGCWRFDWAHNEALLELRFLVNAHYKASADRTRFSNRLKHLGHSIAPELNFGTAWFTCMSHGAFTPDAIHALDLNAFPTATRRAIQRLRERIAPDIYISPPVLNAITETWASYENTERRLNLLHRAIIETVKASPFASQWERLMTIPAASPVRCAAIIVATKGIGDQINLAKFRAALGAFPQIKQSGSSFKARSVRKGYRPAMKLLHMWAQRLISDKTPETVVRTYFAGGEKNGGKKFNAAKARLASVLHGVIRSPNGYEGRLSAERANGAAAFMEDCEDMNHVERIE